MMPTRSLPGSILPRLLRIDGWTWTALLFFGHTLGSLWVIRLIGYDIRTFAIPLSLTFLGSVLAFFMGRRPKAIPSFPWVPWWPVALYLLNITALSARTYPGAELEITTDVFHPVEFFVLGLLMCRPLGPLLEPRGATAFMAALIATGAAFGATDEIHQLFVPGRSCSLLDLILDILGTSAAGALYLVVLRARARIPRGEGPGSDVHGHQPGERGSARP